MMDKKNTILFLGDVVPFRPVRFRNIYSTVVNLECPLTEDDDPIKGKINLNVKKNYLYEIFGDNLLCVSLGNNHILDYGIKGLNSTLAELRSMKIQWFGLNHPTNGGLNPLIVDFHQNKIAFISVVCPSTSPLVSIDGVSYLSLLDTDELEIEVEKLRKIVQRIVLYIHWGIEESSYPSGSDLITARKLIDAGVDIIIGSHAHVPQAIEKYRNGIIAYNLGNFIMPALINIPSYFDESGTPLSVYNKRLMPWNRISWGLVIDMNKMEYKIKRYIFLLNHIIELPFTNLDKYIKLNLDPFDEGYDQKIADHLKKRAFIRRILDFLSAPHVPQKLKGLQWK
jgi:poly-gamma-glutamate synthesis protein (capsule biosynthesis protein)